MAERHFVNLPDLTPREVAIRLRTQSRFNKSIEESEITKFCTGCDLFKGEGIPCPIGKNDQARYVYDSNCGWAVIDGKASVKSAPNSEVKE